MKNIAVTLSIIILSALLFNACRNKSIEPEEYFSFYADGEYFNIPQVSELSFGGEVKTLKAKKIGLTSYGIYASLTESPFTQVSFSISGADIPNEDTVILSFAGIRHFKEQDNDYGMYPPLSGKIIFSERSNSKLTGNFEFDAINADGKIIKITKGKFSIIPTNY